jgi:hypothetical protein
MTTLSGDVSPDFEGTPFGDRLQIAHDSDLNDVLSTQCIG